MTIKQMNELRKTLENYNFKIMDLEKQIILINDEAKKIKNKEDKTKQINEFYNSYEKFYDCLNSQICEFDSETKDEIKTKLNNLVQLVEEDIIENYLK